MTITKRRVAIIGGGATGMALAYFLGRDDYEVTLIEKGPQLSGLLTFTNAPPSVAATTEGVGTVPIERFYHHFFTTDQYLLRLLEELGLSDKILWRPSDNGVFFDGQLYPFTTKVDYARLPFLSWPAKFRGGLSALKLRRLASINIPADETAETFLRRTFGAEGWEKMWRPLLLNKFGNEAGRISAQWIAKRIQTRSGSERGGREVLGYIDGSYRVFFDRLRLAILDQGSQILLNTEVASIPPTSSRGYQINDQEFDIVVSTVAPKLLTSIVPHITMPDVSYRAAIVPLLWLRTKITPYYWINILDTNIPFSVVVNQQVLLPENYYHGLYPMYIGHYVADNSELLTKTTEELFDYYISYLQRLFPGIKQEIVGYDIGRTKFAQPVVTAPWTQLPYTTALPNFYATSMAHIFPEDRGVNFAIREAERITELIQQT